MRRKLLIYLLAISGLFVFLTACNQKNFTGIRVANPDSYRLDIEQMNGTDTHIMEFSAGDVLDIHFETDTEENAVHIKASVKTTGQTGVEMEALHAVSAAALTIYDMCKAIDRGMHITNLRVIEKDGGKSGHFTQK